LNKIDRVLKGEFMNRLKLAGVMMAVALLAGGCASSMSSGGYTRSQARQVQDVQMGVVDSVRQVQLEGTKTPVGTIAGAAVGGIAGSNIGGGKGSTVGAIIGAVAGGLAGSAIEEGVTKKPGLEITIKLDNGRMIAVTQEADEDIRPGDRVRVLSGGGATRVTRN
jgi:outer membrane lipoprotein SlyB